MHEDIAQRDKRLNQVRNQFLFWSIVVVTALNGVLLLVFRPTSGAPTAEPSVAVSDNSLTGAMIGYMRAPERQKPEFLEALTRSALTAHAVDDPALVDALRFLIETFRNEPALTPEWLASLEGVVELGNHSPRLQTVAELELLRIAQDPNRRSLQIATLQALYRIGSDGGAAECILLVGHPRSAALRRESLLLLSSYARDFRGVQSKQSLYSRIIATIGRVSEKDLVLRPLASLALARVGEKVSAEVLAGLLREGSSWGDTRAGVEIFRLSRRFDQVGLLSAALAREDLPDETHRRIENVIAELSARSVAGLAPRSRKK